MKTEEKGDFKLRRATWNGDKKELMEVRNTVFVEEQMVPIRDEIDEHDSVSFHILITDDNGKPVGTGRLNPLGQIGRMAVLKEYRSLGIGHIMMIALMKKALQDGHRIIEMSAQTHAIPMYRKYGFTEVGRVYDEVGIPHQKMVYVHKQDSKQKNSLKSHNSELN